MNNNIDIEELKKINDRMLLNCDKEYEYIKHNLIKEMLKNKRCFFDIKIELAYAILRELNIPEDKLKDVYLNLIDSKYLKEE